MLIIFNYLLITAVVLIFLLICFKFSRNSLEQSDTLYIITPIFNPREFKKRWELYYQFENYILKTPNTVLVTVECAFGDRPFRVTKKHKNHIVLQYRSPQELWLKENLINLGFNHLPEHAKYVAWIDADVTFARPDWVEATIKQLQHYKIVQMFKYAMDLDNEYSPYQLNKGFVYEYLKRVGYSQIRKDDTYAGGHWHPGFAWAARVSSLRALGGLIDTAIAGAGDRHMANAMIHNSENNLIPELTAEYKQSVYNWENKCKAILKRNIGYVDGLLLHYFHGSKIYRRYDERWKILINNKYKPNKDLVTLCSGLKQLNNNNLSLRDGLKQYFSSRNEDSTCLKKSEYKIDKND